MKIAMIGQKGVPATWGGVERHVEEVGARLVAQGHEVVVFTRPNYSDSSRREYRGMTLVSLPTLGTKHFDAIVHSVLSSFATWTGHYDIVHYHSLGPCLASPIARLRGHEVIATIHGRDWKRGKWGGLASALLKLGEWLALRVPAKTICVSQALRDEYLAETGRETEFIPNGITVTLSEDTGALADAGVRDGRYLLFVGRLVPEKGVHTLLEAYSLSGSALPLLIVGDTSGSSDYVAQLKATARPGVHFCGYEYGARLSALVRRAAAVVLPSELEGLPLVLLECVALGAGLVVSDIPPHREVLGAEAEYVAPGDASALAERLRTLPASADSLRGVTSRLRERVVATYDWDRVAEQLAEVYRSAK